MDEITSITIAIIGGTGREGRGLAYRWARAGHTVLIGSRDPARAAETAQDIHSRLPGGAKVQGMSNEQAVRLCQVSALTVPYEAHRSTLEGLRETLQGKLLIDVTVPLVPLKVTRVQMLPAGSAAQEASQILGEGVQVAAAFHNISYKDLAEDTSEADCDVLVTGTSKEARQTTLSLVQAAGFTGWDAGPLENSVVLEGLTSVLRGINKKYGSNHAGIRITGVARPNDE